MTSTITEPAVVEKSSHWIWRGLIDDIPYIAIIVLGVVGASWTSISMRPTATYWLVVTPIFGLICIASGWRHTVSGERIAMIVTQVLQWAAVLVAMYLLTVSDVQRSLNLNATGLMILTVLALGVFLSGVHLRAWKLGVTGAFLALAVPVIAWIQDASLLLLVIAVGLIVLLLAYWWLRERSRGEA